MFPRLCGKHDIDTKETSKNTFASSDLFRWSSAYTQSMYCLYTCRDRNQFIRVSIVHWTPFRLKSIHATKTRNKCHNWNISMSIINKRNQLFTANTHQHIICSVPSAFGNQWSDTHSSLSHKHMFHSFRIPALNEREKKRKKQQCVKCQQTKNFSLIFLTIFTLLAIFDTAQNRKMVCETTTIWKEYFVYSARCWPLRTKNQFYL